MNQNPYIRGFGEFLEESERDSAEAVLREFQHSRYDHEKREHTYTSLPGQENIEILAAEYTQGDYCGDAAILFRDRSDGKLYTVEAGHCSCYGLEGQWHPVATTVEALKLMLEGGWMNDKPGLQEWLREFVK